MRLSYSLRGAASLAVLSMFGATSVMAQSRPATDDGPETVQEIVVTAQKREQSLQDVPIVVTSLSAALLEGSGVKDIKDLQILTPGLTVTSTTSETVTTARIRGVGTVGDNPGLESSVGVVIDGVYRPRNGVSFGDLGEMQRIEVLKGPQGTLFGKNTSAGVINVITEQPKFFNQIKGELTAGNFGAKGGSLSVTGPIVEDVLAGRLYVAKRERDGFYDVKLGDGPRTRRDDMNQDFWTVRGQLLFLPSDSAEIRFIGDYTKREEFCCAGVQIRTGPTSAIVNALATGGQGVSAPANPNARTAFINRPTDQNVEDMGVSAEAKVDFGSFEFTSVTALRRWDSVNGLDIDYTGADILYRNPDGNYAARFDTFSQELRLAGEVGNWNWLVGTFYASEDLSRQDSYLYGADYDPFLDQLLRAATGGAIGLTAVTGRALGTNFVAGSGADDSYTQSAKTLALFTNNNWQVTDQFELTMGLRYTTETKKVRGHQTNFGGNGTACAAALSRVPTLAGLVGAATAQSLAGRACLFWGNAAFNNRVVTQESEEKEWSGTFKGAYRFNENLMVYGSYARGYKGGGFNLDRVQTGITPDASTYFPAETVDSIEFGAKATLANGKLLLNATAFDQKYENFQLNTFLGTAFVVESIPELKSTGVDADLIWFTPIKGLSFQGGITYAKTEYGSFTASSLTNPSRFPELSLLPGQTMSFAPEWSGSAALFWEGKLGAGLKGSWNLAAKYTSEYNTGSDLIPHKMQDAFTLLNGRIGIGAEDDRWTLEFWGQNLTDETYKQVVFNAPLQGTTFQSTVQPNGTFYNPALDTQTYNAFMGQPRTYGMTLRVKY